MKEYAFVTTPKYETAIQLGEAPGSVTVHVCGKFNWLQKFMMKFLLGWKVYELDEE
jgi:hypothetical protein